jgi:hypothetical protein
MKTLLILLTAAFCLITSAFTVKAQTTDVPTTAASVTTTKIGQLPFTIATPGTYVLTSDLSFPSQVTQAIFIQGGLQGPVVLDLKGFAIRGDVTPGSLGIYIGPASVSSNSITIKNGTLQTLILGCPLVTSLI